MKITVKPRRIISNVMVVAMMLSLTISMPLTAKADEPTPYTLTVNDVDFNTGTGEITDYTNTTEIDIMIPSTFTVGEDSYTVTTIGNGAFQNNSLTGVTIPSTVTTIKGSAFRNNSLTSVTIPANVTTIANSAFCNNEIASLTLPNGITSIGYNAFSDNELVSINIPSSLRLLENGVFAGNNLIRITIPDTVTSVESRVFNDNAIEEVIANGSPGYSNTNGIIYARNSNGDDFTTIVSYGGTADVVDFISSDVMIIGTGAFRDNGITSITIPETVTSIGDYAFSTNELMSIIIPDNITSIGRGTFAYNKFTSVIIPDNITSIGASAYTQNDLVSITIGNGVTSIGDHAFAYNELTSVIIPDNVTSIEDGAFANNDGSLTAIDLPATAFGYNLTWEGSTSGSVIEISDLTESYTRTTGTAITYNINYNLAGDETNADSNPADYTVETPTITLSDPTKSGSGFGGWFSDSAFTPGNEVIEIVLGSTGNLNLYAKWAYTLIIDDVSFDTGTGEITDYTNETEKDIIIPGTFTEGGTQHYITRIGVNAFNGKSLVNVIIGDNVTIVGANAFADNDSSLTAIALPATSFGYTATWTDNSNNIVTVITDFTKSYTKTDTNPVDYNINYNLASSAVNSNNPDTYNITTPTIILATPTKANYAFLGWYSDSELTYEVTEIMQGRTGDIVLYPKWTHILTTSDVSFEETYGKISSYTASYTDIVIPDMFTVDGEEYEIQIISNGTFMQDALTSVTIGDNVTSIGSYAFYDNPLTSVIIPNSVTSIGDSAFNINALTSVTIPNSVTSIGANAFINNDLVSITIGNGVMSIGANAFRNNDLVSITIGNGVMSIGDNAFRYNDLTSVIIPDNVTSIGASAFANNDGSLTAIALPATAFGYNVTWTDSSGGSVTEISDFTYSYTRATNTVTYTINYNLADGETNAGSNPADYTVETLTITLNTPTKANYTFFGWYSDSGFTTGNEVTEIVLGSTGDVDLYAKWAYTLMASDVIFDTATGEITDYTNTTEKDIFIPGTFTVDGIAYDVTTIGNYAFYNNALTSVTIGNNVTSIGEAAFLDNALASVTIGNNVTSIGEEAFADNALASVTIGNNVTSIGEEAFVCNALTNVTIPDSVLTIGAYAFVDNALTSVTIGNGVTSIGESAFNINAITQVASAGYENTNGIIYARDASGDDLTTIVSYGGTADVIDFILDNVTTIGAGAFAYNALTSVTIGNNVTSIGEAAFLDNALTNVTIPDNVTSIGAYAFAYNSASLTVIALPNTASGHNVTWEGSTSGSVTEISDFTDTYTRTTGDIITYTINYNLAVDETNDGSNPVNYTVETLTITLNTPTKANYTFFGWYSDSGFTPGNEVIEIVLGSTGDVDLYAKWAYTLMASDVIFDTATGEITDYTNTTEKDIFIPSTFTVGGTDYPVTTIGAYAFEDNSLTSVTIGNGVTSIGASAFANNTALTSITLPDTASGYNVTWKGSTSGSVTEILDFTDTYTRTTVAQPSSGGTSSSATPTEKLEGEINGAIPNEKGVIEVEVELETKHDGTFSLALPENFMADEEVEITIRAGKVKVTLSNTMFTGDEDSVEIVIEPVDKNKLNLSDEVNALIGDLPIYNISLTINGEKAGWESDTAIIISFGLAEDADLDAHKFVVVYIDEYGNVKLLKSSMYSDGEMHFNTTHLSNYAIVYVDKSFDDLGGYAWAAEAIEALAARSVINGTSDTAFSPAGDITRADFITLLVRYFDFNSGTDGNFDDVKPDMYYTDAIAIAKDLGIVTGMGDNMFKPLESIARQDMMVMLERAIKAAGLEKALAQSSISYESFDDSGSVAGYAIDSVDFMVKIGVIQGSDNKLNPTDNITRAETAQVLYNLLNALG